MVKINELIRKALWNIKNTYPDYTKILNEDIYLYLVKELSVVDKNDITENLIIHIVKNIPYTQDINPNQKENIEKRITHNLRYHLCGPISIIEEVQYEQHDRNITESIQKSNFYPKYAEQWNKTFPYHKKFYGIGEISVFNNNFEYVTAVTDDLMRVARNYIKNGSEDDYSIRNDQNNNPTVSIKPTITNWQDVKDILHNYINISEKENNSFFQNAIKTIPKDKLVELAINNLKNEANIIREIYPEVTDCTNEKINERVKLIKSREKFYSQLYNNRIKINEKLRSDPRTIIAKNRWTKRLSDKNIARKLYGDNIKGNEMKIALKHINEFTNSEEYPKFVVRTILNSHSKINSFVNNIKKHNYNGPTKIMERMKVNLNVATLIWNHIKNQ